MANDITNLRAEKAKDGRIFVYFTDGQLSGYALCVAIISTDKLEKYSPEGQDIIKTVLV